MIARYYCSEGQNCSSEVYSAENNSCFDLIPMTAFGFQIWIRTILVPGFSGVSNCYVKGETGLMECRTVDVCLKLI